MKQPCLELRRSLTSPAVMFLNCGKQKLGIIVELGDGSGFTWKARVPGGDGSTRYRTELEALEQGLYPALGL
jgi:hypothetical protein